jgi:hypothetical protein
MGLIWNSTVFEGVDKRPSTLDTIPVGGAGNSCFLSSDGSYGSKRRYREASNWCIPCFGNLSACHFAGIMANSAMGCSNGTSDIRRGVMCTDFSDLIWGATREYKAQFGQPSGTNRFARQFAEGERIAKEVEPRVVPFSIRRERDQK